MKKIIALTTDQHGKLAEFITRWTNIGLDINPANRAEAENGVRLAYTTSGLTPPDRVVWCGSPFSQGVTRAIAFSLDSVWASVWASVGASVRASVGDSGYGQHDASWLGFYEFFAEACGLSEETRKLAGLWLIAKNAGWFLPHQKICWISERPSSLHRDGQGRLHSLTGPALRYPDGWSIYAVHGVRVSSYIIEKPGEITVEKIETEANAEVRRVMVERFGQERFLTDGGAKEIHRDDYGILYRKKLANDEPLVMVKVVNSTPEPDGSFRDYFLRVPPEVTTARGAVAWTFAEQAQQYAPLVET